MTIRTVLVVLELLGGLFGWIWIGASIAAIYFLYGTLANDGPWLNVLWSVLAAIAAKFIAVVVNENRRRLDYMDQLSEHGYQKSEAAAAWRTSADGGFNVLLSLQQAENRKRIDPIESDGDSVNTDDQGAVSE